MNPHPASPSCGCCEGRTHLTPQATANRPGLPALSYRVGTHSTFKETMLGALSEWPPLDDLTTRADEDPTIGLIDAWATVLDVLTFYQERIANEGYLGTAVHSRSVRELAATLGYTPAPAVAAETSLAFELETAPGAPDEITVEVGTKVQSLPGPDEKPQTFETTAELRARPEWNAMPVRRSTVSVPDRDSTSAFFVGTALGVTVGDGLLVVGREREQDPDSDRWTFRPVRTVTTHPELGVTELTWEPKLGDDTVSPAADDVKVHLFRRRAAVFGHNAPDARLMPAEILTAYGVPAGGDWLFSLTGGADDTVDLATVDEAVTAGSWAVLATGNHVGAFEVTSVVTESRADYTLVGQVSRLTLSGQDLVSHFGGRTRDVAVHVRSERLELAPTPSTAPVQGSVLALDGEVTPLGKDRPVIVTGRRAVVEVAPKTYDLVFEPDDGSTPGALAPGDRLVVHAAAVAGAGFTTWPVTTAAGVPGTVRAAPGKLIDVAADENIEPIAETAVLRAGSTVHEGVTTLELSAELRHAYDRAGCRVLANVARASHGESKREVLGSGDAAVPGQRFTLSDAPLTRLPAGTAAGAASTLTVRVNGEAWTEVPTLYAQDQRARVHVVHEDEDGTITTAFGDGVDGARIRTGEENVTAEYRVGAGRDGMVEAGQLSLLMTRPLGLKGVTNPLPPQGGADGESMLDSRRNAPLTVLTFDRIVSTTDYEDFARRFPGVAKAQGLLVWDGARQTVHLTIAGPGGEALGPGHLVHAKLVDAILGSGGRRQPFLVDSFEPIHFDLTAGLFVDPANDPEVVVAAARDLMLSSYGFNARDLAAPVPVAEVAAALQGVAGVLGVDIDRLATGAGSVASDLVALTARATAGGIAPSQLLILNPDGLTLVVRP